MRHGRGTLLALLCLTGSGAAQAVPITVANAGFEDVTGLAAFNEFYFGQNPGWTFHDPNNVVGNGNGSNGIFTGTLEPAAGSPWFNGNTAPEGNRVAIMFGFGTAASAGAGEYGLEQTLTGQTLQANTTYTLEVEVGNIAEGTAQDGTFFPLGGFPGYRVELLAGGVVVAMDNNTLSIGEGEFANAVVSFTAGSTDALLGEDLGIRLVNLNQIPTGNDPQAPFDLEVDFDDVRLSAAPVPAPGVVPLLLTGALALAWRRRRAAPS